MELYSLVAKVIAQLGRRGALMISTRVNHPDIMEFIDVKNDLQAINKANISVRVFNDFMQAVENDDDYELWFERKATGQKINKTVKAKDLFRKIAESNWYSGEPGMLFWDRVTSWCIQSEDKEFEFAGVNPCAEQTLPRFGSCLLGSINLSAYVTNPFDAWVGDSYFDFHQFSKDVASVVTYMNEVLDEGLDFHPLQEQRDCARGWRQIGVGIMGLADMFIKLKIKYGDKESIKLSKDIGNVMINSALRQSALLAKQYGTYPKYNKDAILKSPFILKNANYETLKMIKEYGLRNSQLLTVAP